jgi:hypothetical protein
MRKTKRVDLRTAKPCGPDAPTLAFKSRRSICAVMVARKPGHQGATVI